MTNPTAGIPDFLALNTTQPPFDDPALRKAVALAVDLPQIRDIAYFGAGEVGSQEVPSGSPWYSAESGALGRDVEAAKAILAEAGIETPLTIDYLGLPQYPELLKTGEVVREQLKDIGIEMNIEPVDVSIWFDRFINGDYQITSAYQERTIDPDNFYALVLRSGADINTTGYSNPALDALIDQARTETDQATRQDLYDADPRHRRRGCSDHLRPLRNDQLPDAQQRLRIDRESHAGAATGERGLLRVTRGRDRRAGRRAPTGPSPCSGVPGGDVTEHGPEPEVTHAGVDHLWLPRRRSIAEAVAGGTEM